MGKRHRRLEKVLEPQLHTTSNSIPEIEKVITQSIHTNPHIDDIIDDSLGYRSEEERYARWMFMHFRLPEHLRIDFDQFMKEHKLFCIYKQVKYRVTGCSRLGDIWLTKDFNRDRGYEYRVAFTDCSNWTKE